MQFDVAMDALSRLTTQAGGMLDGLLLLFFRILAFIVVGPIFNRKNLPFMLKISLSFFLTGTLFWMLTPERIVGPASTQQTLLLVPLLLNITVGSLLGFIANLVLETVSSAGSLVNNEIGLSAAALLDPAKGGQTQIIESLFSYVGMLLFIDMGGVHWMVSALKRSVELFPLMATKLDLAHTISLPSLVTMTGNVMLVAVELIAPILVVSMTMDVMLGVVNRTAQQMPVFQLSAALKPSIGIGIMLLTLSTFLQAVGEFFREHAHFF
jgi:flagellar biosynthetic protein FliR